MVFSAWGKFIDGRICWYLAYFPLQISMSMSYHCQCSRTYCLTTLANVHPPSHRRLNLPSPPRPEAPTAVHRPSATRCTFSTPLTSIPSPSLPHPSPSSSGPAMQPTRRRTLACHISSASAAMCRVRGGLPGGGGSLCSRKCDRMFPVQWPDGRDIVISEAPRPEQWSMWRGPAPGFVSEVQALLCVCMHHRSVFRLSCFVQDY